MLLTRTIALAVTLVATLWLSVLSVVSQTSTAKPPAPGGTFGVIRGKVVNDAGQPLANATVAILRIGSRRAEQATVTDREGKFELTSLEPFTYQLFARLAGYTPLPQDPSGEESRYRIGDTATLVLVKGAVITGTVTNQTGEPVVGIGVHVRLTRDAERQPWPYSVLSNDRMTDDRGVYRIYGLPAGTYVVSAGGAGELAWRGDLFETDMPTYAPGSTRDSAEEFSVRAGEEINVDIRFRSEPGRSISGRASAPSSPEGRGFGIRLSLADGSGAAIMMGQQPDKRGFVFHGLADGDYDLIAFSANASEDFMWSEPKRVKVNGADVTGVELITVPLSAVSGKVVLQESKATECKDKQRPRFSEMLVIVRPKGAAHKFEVPFWAAGSPINPDADGNVSLKNLLAGQYYFDAQFTGKSWYLDSITLPAQATAEGRTPLQAKPMDAAKTWTTLKSGQRLSGLTITIAQGAASVEGQIERKDAERLAVYLVPAERERADDVLRFFTAVVGEDGKVKLNNVAPGRYLVLATPEVVSLTKLRSPDGTGLRSWLRREAEAAKSELELKPCQNLTGFQL